MSIELKGDWLPPFLPFPVVKTIREWEGVLGGVVKSSGKIAGEPVTREYLENVKDNYKFIIVEPGDIPAIHIIYERKSANNGYRYGGDLISGERSRPLMMYYSTALDSVIKFYLQRNDWDLTCDLNRALSFVNVNSYDYYRGI